MQKHKHGRLVLARALSAATFVFAIAGKGLAGGPDIFVCNIGGTTPGTGFINYGAINGIRAFSVSTIACNQGDAPARWDDELPEPDNAHPVIATNMFRLRNGRFEQIGQSWVKHGYAAAQIDWCTKCQPGGNDNMLGVGCCDPYSAVVNGAQLGMGPKSEVNASTGEFPFPFCWPSEGGIACPAPNDDIARRLQVRDSDLDTSPSVRYFIEVQYVLPDDAVLAQPRSDYNNASYRQVAINSTRNIASWAAGVVQQEPAIRAWKLNNLASGEPDPDILETAVDIPDDGRFWIAAKATDLGNGTWRYEYAVQNLNSHRSGGAFIVPLPTGEEVQITNIGFHDVDYHSGEPYASTDWEAVVTGASIRWTIERYDDNPNANALRWGTLYNFRFDANAPPVQGQAALKLFRPPTAGMPWTVMVNTVAPAAGPPPACAADIVPDGGDFTVGIDELLAVINAWGNTGEHPADITGDAVVGVNDLLAVISLWGACP